MTKNRYRSRRGAVAKLILIAVALVATADCSRKPPDATPEGAVEAFLQCLDETPYDPGALARAYALLAPPARAALQARAVRATSITGRAVPPQAMLGPAWSPPRFDVERMHATVTPEMGTRASVDVFGADTVTQHVVVPVVREEGREGGREGGGWRIDVTFPDVPASTPR